MSRSPLVVAASAVLIPFVHGQTNTLLLVADDVGVDAISVYKEGRAPVVPR